MILLVIANKTFNRSVGITYLYSYLSLANQQIRIQLYKYLHTSIHYTHSCISINTLLSVNIVNNLSKKETKEITREKEKNKNKTHTYVRSSRMVQDKVHFFSF